MPIDPENIGWVGCININKDEESVLLVKNLKLHAQVDEELKKRNWPNSRYYVDMVKAELEKNGELEKPWRWELGGSGRIPWWAGNETLQKEFQALAPEVKIKFSKKSKFNIDSPAQKEFLSSVAERVLQDESLLLRAAGATVEYECVEETGLQIIEKELICRFSGKNRDSGGIYPKFLYLVKAAEGELRREPVKEEISAPKWIRLSDLYVWKDRDIAEEPFLIHKSHLMAILMALGKLVDEGEQKFLAMANLLAKRMIRKSYAAEFRVPRKKTTRPQEEEKLTSETTESWEELTKEVEPLQK